MIENQLNKSTLNPSGPSHHFQSHARQSRLSCYAHNIIIMVSLILPCYHSNYHNSVVIIQLKLLSRATYTPESSCVAYRLGCGHCIECNSVLNVVACHRCICLQSASLICILIYLAFDFINFTWADHFVFFASAQAIHD